MRIAILFLAALSTALSQAVSFPGPGMPATSGGGGTFLHHRTLTIDHTQVGGSTLASFPVLVSLTLGAGKVQNANCYDVILTSDSGGTTKIPWDPETAVCNQSTGAFSAWVLISSISSSIDTVFYAFYDNAAISSPQNTGSVSAANVWSAPGYLGVFHLSNGSTLTANDSTSNGFNGTLGSTTHAPSATTGEIDGGAAFSAASTQYINISTSMNPAGTKTLSFWTKFTSHSGLAVVMALDGVSGGDEFMVWLDSNTMIASAASSTGASKQATTSLSDGVWYHVVVTKTTSQTTSIYVNGADVTTADVIDFLGSGSGNYLGVDFDGATAPFNGALDEVRLFNGTLAAGWITAEYNSQKPSSTFLTVGSEV